MPRKPRQFEYNKPIDVISRYTRSVYVPPKELWRVRLLVNELRKKYDVKVLSSFLDQKYIKLRLYFSSDCGCTLSRVMQWFLTRLSKCVNGIMKSHGKVFYDRFVSKILEVFESGKKYVNKTIVNTGSEEVLKSIPVSDPGTEMPRNSLEPTM